MTPVKVLIVAEHASARFGGEAALPLHVYRVLKARGIPVWLVSHARTRDELKALHPDDDHLHFIEDTALHLVLWRLAHWLPRRIDYITTGFLMRVMTQLSARRLARELIRSHAIDVVHQPIPVSPREPSLLYGLGAPIVIGPMNGGMTYPPGFRTTERTTERVLIGLARTAAVALNRLMPGKRRAARLLVANPRTRRALPAPDRGQVVELVENGVDMSVWARVEARSDAAPGDAIPTWLFMGRLVDWKAVDLLLDAFADARRRRPMRLVLVGDGDQRNALQTQARALGCADAVAFTGWLSQAECAVRLAQADGLVLSSLYECGGAVVLEAMAAGKPVIATAWGGPLDYLDDTCGVLVPPDSRRALIQGFADAMVALAEDPSRRSAMGAAGRARVLALFDWEQKANRLLDIYAEAIDASTTTPPRST